MKFEPDSVLNELNKLKPFKSPGPDNLHPYVLKSIAETLCTPLARIFQSSLDSMRLPTIWKHANITAIYKKGDKSDPNNYRPISLTSIACKIMESIVRNYLMNHLISNNLLSPKQFGFISGRSVQLQLLLLMDHWTKVLDEGNHIDVVYMDFKKAFDSVPHRRLLSKLNSYGIANPLLGWIEQFLSGRYQRVCIHNSESKLQHVTSGIPQGSVLGPILFVIYINDLPDVISSYAFMFADDTKLYRPITCTIDPTVLQSDLDSLQDWSSKWLLMFHPDKCKSMTVCKSTSCQASTYSLKPNDRNSQDPRKPLNTCKEEKDLGVTFDNQLSFSPHIYNQINKANKLLGMIRRSFIHLDDNIFLPLYKSIIRPHLEYAVAVWSPTKAKLIEDLERVQRRATKLLPHLAHLSYPDRLKHLRLPTLAYRRLRGDMIETYKILQGIYDSSVSDFLPLHHYTRTRGHNLKLFIQQASTNIRKGYFSVRIAEIWNNLPATVVNSPSVKSFEANLDRCWSDISLRYDFRAPVNTSEFCP